MLLSYHHARAQLQIQQGKSGEKQRDISFYSELFQKLFKYLVLKIRICLVVKIFNEKLVKAHNSFPKAFLSTCQGSLFSKLQRLHNFDVFLAPP